MSAHYQVRQVTFSDLGELERLEKEVWSDLGTPVLEYSDLEAWLSEESPYFLLAEDEKGYIGGYCFSREINFVMTREGVDAFLDPELMTGKGMSNHPPVSGGGSAYGICVSSRRPGSGKALTIEMLRLFEEFRTEYFISFSRLSGLNEYLGSVEKSLEPSSQHWEKDVALWYAHENASMLNLRSREYCRPKPALELPNLQNVDPIFGFHVKGMDYGLLDVQEGYMSDPASRNYGALIASPYPHVRT